MDRSSLLRWLLIGAAIFLFLQVGWPWLTGKNGKAEHQPLAGLVDNLAPEKRAEEVTCDLTGPRFSAQVTSQGAALKHLWMTDPKYHNGSGPQHEPIDLVTTTLPSRRPLRTDLRDVAGTATQVPYNDLDWQLVSHNDKGCVFVYEDDKAKLEKTISVTERPFELSVAVSVTNKAKERQKHRLSVEQSDWRTQKETAGSWGRVSEFMTTTDVRTDEVHRNDPSDFEADEFDDAEFTDEKWRRPAGSAIWAAVSSSYFSKAAIHVEGPAQPYGETLIEEVWRDKQFPNKSDDPEYGHVFRSRLNYGVQELAPNATASYKVLAYFGPKEREVLAAVGGGPDYHTIDLLDLGTFGWIGKVLIRYLYFLHGLVGTWGIAICLLTITVKVLLFPLSITQIKSAMAMRKLKPQMDELNEKYKDDATQRGLKLQELWRKNNVTNPMLGCLPVLLQMPVWFALYTALQTAVELYHTPFLWFPDLSAPDRFYTIPIVLGASSFLQQLLMPMQGDPLQQKMMKYMMPAMFTVFMLFLPAGLGIYFLTNTWLGIAQQLAVERYYKSQQAKEAPAGSAQSGGAGTADKPDKPSKESGKAKKAEPKTA